MIAEDARSVRAEINVERVGRVRGEMRRLPMWVDDRGGRGEVKPAIM